MIKTTTTEESEARKFATINSRNNRTLFIIHGYNLLSQPRYYVCDKNEVTHTETLLAIYENGEEKKTAAFKTTSLQFGEGEERPLSVAYDTKEDFLNIVLNGEELAIPREAWHTLCQFVQSVIINAGARPKIELDFNPKGENWVQRMYEAPVLGISMMGEPLSGLIIKNLPAEHTDRIYEAIKSTLADDGPLIFAFDDPNVSIVPIYGKLQDVKVSFENTEKIVPERDTFDATPSCILCGGTCTHKDYCPAINDVYEID